MDTIHIHALKIETIIGVYPWERKVKQALLLNLELATNCKTISEKDDISLAINYADVAEVIQQHVDQHHYQLIETLAEQLAKIIKEQFSVAWLRLCIQKPTALANAQYAAVTIER